MNGYVSLSSYDFFQKNVILIRGPHDQSCVLKISLWLYLGVQIKNRTDWGQPDGSVS